MAGIIGLNGNPDPITILNISAYTTLFIPANPATPLASYSNISSNATPKQFLDSIYSLAISSNLNNKVLSATAIDPNSTARIIQFLSGGGSTAGSPPDYRILSSVLLSNSSGYKGIVDSYIAPAASSYTYSTASNILVSDTALYTFTASNHTIASNCVVGKLISDGFLLGSNDIYVAGDLATGASHGKSLVYLYKEEEAGNTLSPLQQTLKATLDVRNLLFFSAYIVEYCYYSTRYNFLLNQYFNVYTQATTAYTSPTSSALSPPISNLFKGTGSAENQYTPGGTGLPLLSQSDYLKGIAYQLACLNTRMTDMRRLLNFINQYYATIYSTLQTDINLAKIVGSDTQLTTAITSLQSSAVSANDYLTDQDFRKGILDYTAEKNRYSNILLGLYAFLNISALAVIFNMLRK